MALYEFRCIDCKTKFEAWKRASHRNDPATCPRCGRPARRIISVPQKVEPARMTPEQVRRSREVWE